MVPGWKASQGATKEYELARELKKPVFQQLSALRSYLSGRD